MSETGLQTINNSTGEIMVEKLYTGISSKPLNEKQQQILRQDIDESLVKKRPDGMIYIDGIRYRELLDEAFGIGGWALLPLNSHVEPFVMHTQNGDKNAARIFVHGQLWCEGRFISESVGEDVYYIDNGNDSYATGWEKAKSNLLVRCCKELGIFRKLWDKEFAEAMKSRLSSGTRSNSPAPTVTRKPAARPTASADPKPANGDAKKASAELLKHFNLKCKKEVNGEYTNFVISGASEPVTEILGESWLIEYARGPKEEKNAKKGMWIKGGAISFSEESLRHFMNGLHKRKQEESK